MSLRSVGNQLLQTAPSSLLMGASTASLSLWIVVNPGNNVVDPNGANLFGDTGGKCSVSLSGSNNLTMRWTSRNGNVTGVAESTQTLVVGTTYHLAMTWQSGTQQFFLNGSLVYTATQTGTIGDGTSTPQSFRIGSDQSGANVTLGEPTIWSGYALTAQDVVNIRDRVASPASLSPSSIVLRWSLSGQEGASVQIGDLGLSDASTTGLNLATIVGSAPTYLLSPLTYVAPPRLGKVSIAPSGKALSLVFHDGQGKPTNLVAITPRDDVQALNLLQMPSGGSFRLGFHGQTTAPIAVNLAPPDAYGLYTITGLTAGQPYSFAVFWEFLGFNYASQTVYEFLDGSTLLGTASPDQRWYPGYQSNTTNYIGDHDGSTTSNGSPMEWHPLGTFTPSGTSITVRITGSTDGRVLFDVIRLKNSGGSPTYYPSTGPAFSHHDGINLTYQSSPSGYSYTGFRTGYGTGSGTGATIKVVPSAIQSALLALSSVTPGGVTVSPSAGTDIPPYLIQFTGPMGQAAQAAITSTSPAVTVVHTVVGVGPPTYRVNGGTPIPLPRGAWGPAYPSGLGGYQAAPYLPFYYAPFHQAASAVSVLGCYQGDMTFTGSWDYYATGINARPVRFLSTTAGQSTTFPFRTLPPGTYRLAIRYSSATGNDTAASFVVKNAAGATIATVAVNQTIDPADFTADGVTWKTLGTFTTTGPASDLVVVLTAGSTPVAIEAVRRDRLSSDDSVAYGPTDSVTISFPSGYFTSVAGLVPGVTDQPVENLVGGSLLAPFVANGKTMKFGYNPVCEYVSNEVFMFSNLAKRLPELSQYYRPEDTAVDANGYPTKCPTSQYSYIYLSSNGPNLPSHADGLGVDNLPNGLYLLRWKGASNWTLELSENWSEVDSYRIINPQGNQRVYRLNKVSGCRSPNMRTNIFGTTPDPTDPAGLRYLMDFREAEAYPPDPSDPSGETVWTNPPTFHPWAMEQMGRVDSLRFLDPMNTNFGGFADSADLKPVTHINRTEGRRSVDVAIATIREPTVAKWWNPLLYQVEVVTTTPHGLFTGSIVALQGTGTATFSDGSSLDLAAVAGCLAKVVDATTLHVRVGYNATATTMTNTLTGGRIGNPSIGSFWPIEEMIDLCNQKSADCWLTLPHSITDACVASIADLAATRLNKNLRVEYSNEVWNYSFSSGVYNHQLTYLMDGSSLNYPPGYVRRAEQIHEIVAARFAAAGMPASKLVRVISSQGPYASGPTAAVVAALHAQGVTADELAVAVYWFNGGKDVLSEPSLMDVYDLLVVDQCVDLLELNIEYGDQTRMVSDHRPILDAAGFASTKLVAYEASPDILVPGCDSTRPNFYARQYAVQRHPRMFHVVSRFLQKLQDSGLSLYNQFFFGQLTDLHAWSAWQAVHMRAGTGNPTLDAANISTPLDLSVVKSEVGGAYQRWSGLVGASPTNPQNPRTPGRNGMIRRNGELAY